MVDELLVRLVSVFSDVSVEVVVFCCWGGRKFVLVVKVGGIMNVMVKLIMFVMVMVFVIVC